MERKRLGMRREESVSGSSEQFREGEGGEKLELLLESKLWVCQFVNLSADIWKVEPFSNKPNYFPTLSLFPLQVLLYDPLYLWTISPLKAQNLQRRADTDETNTSTTGGGDIILGDHASTSNGNNATNKMAERVLLRLQEKLARGIEDGVPLSVSGQVNTLIQEATDPANLCQLFPGWQPWI